MSQVYCCDRCGKYFQQKITNTVPYYSILEYAHKRRMSDTGEFYTTIDSIELDLCLDCHKKLTEWFENV